jgi:predicted ArsR family transcriptional regulator
VSASGTGPAEDTRGQLLALLCSAARTATELAGDLSMSANGVRWHLERLEQDGLVERRVVRRGVGKPAHVYQLTTAGSVRLSRAYLPVLTALLTVTLERVGAGEGENLLREVGRTLARQYPPPGGSLRERVDAAVGLLGDLGGISRAAEQDGAYWIHGVCCPLRALVPDHPLACKAVEALLEDYIGAPVHEECAKAGPSCRLAVGAAAR